MGLFDLANLVLDLPEFNKESTAYKSKFQGEFSFTLGDGLGCVIGTKAEQDFGFNYKTIYDPYTVLQQFFPKMPTGPLATMLLAGGCFNWYIGRYQQATYFADKIEFRRGGKESKRCSNAWTKETPDEKKPINEYLSKTFALNDASHATLRQALANTDKKLGDIVKALLALMGLGTLVTDLIMLGLSTKGGDSWEAAVQIMKDYCVTINNMIQELLVLVENSDTGFRWAFERALEAEWWATWDLATIEARVESFDAIRSMRTNDALKKSEASASTIGWTIALFVVIAIVMASTAVALAAESAASSS